MNEKEKKKKELLRGSFQYLPAFKACDQILLFVRPTDESVLVPCGAYVTSLSPKRVTDEKRR